MTRINRILDIEPCRDLVAYMSHGGGQALESARLVEPGAIIDTLLRSGLRGRGGAGFPTATKWASVAANSSSTEPTPVVVNGAEGEPSTFKDRAILRSNPYRVLEGALIACHVVRSDVLVVALKRSFEQEAERVLAALAEMRDAGWLRQIDPRVVSGPGHYLFGEETALLEVIDERQPFPRVTPPWRRGISTDDSDSMTPGELANASDGEGSPALVNNVETFANVALIVRHGPEWFRQVGTKDSPGTIVCTVVGDVMTSGVGEFAMGTPLSEIIESLGSGARPDRRIIGVLPGASGAIVAEADLGVPLTHEAFRAIGSGLGSAGFMCIDDSHRLLDIAFGVARFLSVESCGQCMPCKDDGLAVAAVLRAAIDGTAPDDAVEQISARLDTIADGARCSLAVQHQTVLRSMLDDLAGSINATLAAADAPAVDDEALETPASLAPLQDITDGVATYDESQQSKQPDWSFDARDSQAYPAQLLQDVPCVSEPPDSRVDLPVGAGDA